MGERHVLIVPVNLDEDMQVEHPESCPQHGHADPVRHSDGYCACVFQEEIRTQGLESYFRREVKPGPFESSTVYVAPGRHPVLYWVDSDDEWTAGLALVEGGESS